MRFTLVSFAIYLSFCTLGFCGGAIALFTSSSFILFCLGIERHLDALAYIIGIIGCLFGAFLALGPALITHFCYDFCISIIDRIGSEVVKR